MIYLTLRQDTGDEAYSRRHRPLELAERRTWLAPLVVQQKRRKKTVDLPDMFLVTSDDEMDDGPLLTPLQRAAMVARGIDVLSPQSPVRPSLPLLCCVAASCSVAVQSRTLPVTRQSVSQSH
jgi:hypothetical protein